MKKGTFRLMVFAPGDYIDCAWSLESASPFAAIHVGDILHSDHLHGWASDGFTAPVVQVVQHVSSIDEHSFVQQTCVYLGADCWNGLQDILKAKVGPPAPRAEPRIRRL